MLFQSPPGADNEYLKYVEEHNIDILEIEALYSTAEFTDFTDKHKEEWKCCTDLKLDNFLALTEWIPLTVGDGCVLFTKMKSNNILCFHNDTTAVIYQRNLNR